MAHNLRTVRSRMLRDAKRRAEALGLPFDLAAEDICVPSHCPILGLPLEVGGLSRDNSPSLDRVRPDLGYVPGNVVVVSMRANRIKADASLAELKALVSFYFQLIHETEHEK